MVKSTTEDTVASPLLVVEDLKKHYKQPFSLFGKSNPVKAVDGISFDLHAGKALGLVGESGCGKSTAGRAILKLDQITSGKIFFKGIEITHLQGEALRELRKDMQIVFQDPYSSLNGRMRVKDILAEPFKVHNLHAGREYQEVKHLLNMVGLLESSFDKLPHEFSGGQRQRIVIARAIALRPQFIVCDEPVSALDVSVQSQIVNLFSQLQKELGLSYLFISHGLSVVRHICDRVGVMYLGKLVELGDKKSVFSNPLHPYTQALINAIPTPNPSIQRTREKITLEGDLPSPMNPPSGCHFHTRCPYAVEICKMEKPKWREVEPAHWVACHFAPLT